MSGVFTVNGRVIGPSHPTWFIAELSGNHLHEYSRAERLVREAAAAGADAVKLQTYTADTITVDCDNDHFRVAAGSPWAGRTLHDLYTEAATPWEWQPKLKRLGDELGVEVFSTPFDASAVDFLEREVKVKLYKIASFEVVDLPLLEKVAATGKPVIMSTGMATLEEIDRAVRTLRAGGAGPLCLLRCVSAYPAAPAQMHLRTIPHLAEAFGVVAGLSDHTLSPAVAVAAVTLGARVVEKHLTLRRADGGPDAEFSLEPAELQHAIAMIRDAEAALGAVRYGAGTGEEGSVIFRKSLFVVQDIAAGEPFTTRNVRVIRPGSGLPPAKLPLVLGRVATRGITRGTPLRWELVGAPHSEPRDRKRGA